MSLNNASPQTTEQPAAMARPQDVEGHDGAPADWMSRRDRDAVLNRKLIKKGQRRIDGMDDKIIGLYAAGFSTRDIRAHLEEV